MPSFALEQSMPLCYALSAVGGLLEVGSIAVLAVPDAREREGATLPWWLPKVALASNVTMQTLGSLASNLFATWFGPVSVVAPIYFSATLVANMLIFGFILGLEFFDKLMIIGTYVIAIGTILLQIVGPDIQEDQDIGVLLSHPYAYLWFVALLVGMIISTAFMVYRRYEEKLQILILLVARATSYTLNLTVSRAFLLNPTYFVLVTFLVIKIVSGMIYTYAIVVQSTTVTQSKFVPINAVCIMLMNAITGVIVWEDWRVISSWTGYVCVFLLFALGCDLLLTENILTNESSEYGAKKQVDVLIENTPIKRILHPNARQSGSRNLYVEIPNGEAVDIGDSFVTPANYISRRVSIKSADVSGDRRQAWKKILTASKQVCDE
ncbi:hypothetical protein ACHAXT_000504 [Thalassiosira profunda]